MEMNASPDPKWAVDFYNQLKEQFRMDVLQASSITAIAEKHVKLVKKELLNEFEEYKNDCNKELSRLYVNGDGTAYVEGRLHMIETVIRYINSIF